MDIETPQSRRPQIESSSSFTPSTDGLCCLEKGGEKEEDNQFRTAHDLLGVDYLSQAFTKRLPVCPTPAQHHLPNPDDMPGKGLIVACVNKSHLTTRYMVRTTSVPIGHAIRMVYWLSCLYLTLHPSPASLLRHVLHFDSVAGVRLPFHVTAKVHGFTLGSGLTVRDRTLECLERGSALKHCTSYS